LQPRRVVDDDVQASVGQGVRLGAPRPVGAHDGAPRPADAIFDQPIPQLGHRAHKQFADGTRALVCHQPLSYSPAPGGRVLHPARRERGDGGRALPVGRRTPAGIIQMDSGEPITLLAGVHAGCFELFGMDRVRAIRDLKGKTVAVS
jgi:hypothetical protein